MSQINDPRSNELRSKPDYTSAELMGRTLLSMSAYDIDAIAKDDPTATLAYLDRLIAVLDSEQDVGDLGDADCDLLMLLDRVEAQLGPWRVSR